MNQYFAHIHSHIPVSISANGEYLNIVEKRKPLDLLVTKKDLYLSVSPLGNYYPYTIHISNNYKCVDTTNNCIIVPYYNNHYDIYLKHNKIYEMTANSIVLNTTFGKTNIAILNGTNSLVSIYDNGNLVYSDIVRQLSTATAISQGDHIIIKGYTINDEYYLLILNSNYETIFSGYFDNMEEHEHKIVGISNTYDIAKHCHICEISLSNMELKDYYIVKENIDICTTDELIPRAFLEAIKVSNYTLAKKYLGDTLVRASNSHFKTYFGDIQSIYYNSYNNSSPVNYTVYSGDYKSYSFELQNGKIIDIEEMTM